MEVELESFWKEKRKIKLNGEWKDLADHIDDRYMPKNGTLVSVTLTDNMVTFIKRANSGGQSNYSKPKEDFLDGGNYSEPRGDFQDGGNYKPDSSTKHVAGSGLSDEELVATLNRISAENNVFATQTHIVDGKWSYLCFIK